MSHSGSQRSDKLRGRLYVLAAAVMWSSSGFFAKSPMLADWNPHTRGLLMAFWRAVFAALVLLPLVRCPRWRWAMLPMLISFTAMNITYMNALSLTEATNAIWLQSTAPLWVFVATPLWLRDPIRLGDWLLLAIGVTGVVVILCGEVTGAAPLGVVMGLLAGLFYAGVVISLRWLRNEELVWLIALNHLVTACLLAPLVVYLGIWPTGDQWPVLAGFGIFQMAVPYVLFAHGVRRIPGHEASIIALLEPVLVPVWVFLAWHHTPGYQSPAWWTLLGGGLILVGLMFRYFVLRGR